MAHLPVNHPARPVYRVLAGGIGLYILAFGVVGLVVSLSEPFFARGDIWALGLRTNPAFSILSIASGTVVFGGAVYGHNVDHFINLWGSIVFLVAGVVMMTLLRTELNLLNFAIVNCIASFVIGVVLLSAGLYGKQGPPELEDAEDRVRRGELPREEETPAAAEARSDVGEGEGEGGRSPGRSHRRRAA
jgi:hypothetical protein